MGAFYQVIVSVVFTVPSLLLSQVTTGKQQQVESHSAQAREFLKSNRPDLAAREFAAILAVDPNNADAHANLGVLIFFQGGDNAKAASELRSALKLRPDLWKIQALLGLCEKRLGQNESARTHLEQSFPHLDEEKLRVQTGMELAELYYAANDLDKAASVVGVLRRLRPEDPDILYTAHRIYSDLADETMLSVAMTAPDSARMRQLMGNEMARRGNIDGAIAQYRQALKINAQLPGVHFQLAEMLRASSSESDRAQAEKEYEGALAYNPLDAKSECRLGEIAIERSDLKGALARYSRAVELQPDDADANLGLARALMQTGQSDKAEHCLVRAAASEPFDPAIHMRLATLYRESGRAKDAARELAEFQRLKNLKERLTDVYREMRLQPPREDRQDQNVLK
jgi:tetratricopeptide (TPR) repeat protein